MIELPDWVVPNGAVASLIDFGIIQRPSTAGPVQRIDRKGNRFRATISLPAMRPERSAIIVSRLLQAKSDGLKMAYPGALILPQGSPGSPVVDGAGQGGRTLAVRGLRPGYALREGYWLSIEDATGRHYLHNCNTATLVPASGEVSIAITPALRHPFADGAAVHLAVPMIEGLIEGDAMDWEIPVHGLIALQFPIEEAG